MCVFSKQFMRNRITFYLLKKKVGFIWMENETKAGYRK